MVGGRAKYKKEDMGVMGKYSIRKAKGRKGSMCCDGISETMRRLVGVATARSELHPGSVLLSGAVVVVVVVLLKMRE